MNVAKHTFSMLLILCLSSALDVSAIAQDPPVGPTEGELVFDARRHDYGKVNDDEKLHHDFAFEVRGEAPVVIVDLRPACTCTIGDILVDGRVYEKGAPIPPGAKGLIRTAYDPTGIVGIKPSIVHVDTAAGKATYDLVVIADVTPLFEIRPRPVRFGKVRSGQPVEKEVWIRSERFDSFEIVDWGGPLTAALPDRPEGIDDDEYEVLIAQAQKKVGLRVGAKPAGVQVRIDRVEPAKVRLVITLTPVIAEGPFRLPLRFLTNRARVLSFSLRGIVLPAVFIEPSPLVLGVQSFGTRDDWGMRIVDLDGTRTFRVLSVTVDSPKREHVEVEAVQQIWKETMEPVWLIRLGLLETMPRGGFAGEIEVRTDHPLYPVLKTRFQGIIR